MTGHGVEVRPLDPAGTSALQEWLERARQARIDVDDLDSIDRAYVGYFDQVLRQPADQREDPTPRLTTIAMALGEHLRRHGRLHWRVARDGEGEDLALTSADDTGVLFPLDPVADAWGRQERFWLADFARGVLAELDGPWS